MLLQNERAKEKIWLSKAENDTASLDAVNKIASVLGIDPVVATLLYNRGYQDPSSAMSFLKMEREMLRNPFDLMDMDKGVDRLIRAIREKEKITVYGDYDVDGVTAVCTLYLYLKSKGCKIDYYIPNRSGEGYGVSCAAIDTIKASGTSLIVTVDTGITATLEVEYAKTIGVDFIVTDHHECRAELPLADAVINPHRPDCRYPFKDLAGVGVIFKLISALEEKISGSDRLSATLRILNEYSDLVAIGTIADVMPIKEENRIIVKYGLNLIDKSPRIGLAALIDRASGRTEVKRNDFSLKKKKKTKVTSSLVGYTLAPRINAAGRVRSATLAVELFLSEDYRSASDVAEQLCEANRERQNEENSIMREAYAMIEKLDIDENPVIVLDADNWHHGVIGIVSSRITEKYCRPSILVSFEGNDASHSSGEDVGKGSGRSIKGLNLVDALCYCSDDLVKFGGHELAAGLSVTREMLPNFKKRINEFARNNLCEGDMIPTIEADCEIDFKSINMKLAEQLQLLEPFGVSNPVPLFIMNNVTVAEVSGISENKHTKFALTDGRGYLQGMFFSNSPSSLGVSAGDKIDILFSIDINEWQDRKSVQLILRDVKLRTSKSEAAEFSRRRFAEIKGGATFSEKEDIIPERRDFVAVYKFIQNSIRAGIDTFAHHELEKKLEALCDGYTFGYAKLKFMILVFRELNIITIEEMDGEVYRFSIRFSSNKQNLEKSSILKKLRTQIR